MRVATSSVARICQMPTERVELTYLGHSSFLWTTPDGVRVVIDPFANTHPHGWQWFLRPFPDTEADVVLVTHDHFDHNNAELVRGEPLVIRSATDARDDRVHIEAFEDRHATPDDIPNTIFVVESAALRFCHLGDNRPDVPQQVVDAIGRVDVLIVPVDDSSHLLRFWEVRQLIETFRPRLVVPVHHLVGGLTDPGSTLLSADTWLRTQERVQRIGRATVRLDPASLPPEREVWVLQPSAAVGDPG